MRATVVFADETGFSLRPNVRRTWAPRGRTPRIKHNFNWKRLHAVGAIGWRHGEADPVLHLQVQDKGADAGSSIFFIDALRREFEGPVVLIWDGLPAHRCTKVSEHIAKQPWLSVERLPAYAPELNPVEYLWASLKAKHTANICDEYIAALTDRIERAYQRYCREPDILKGFLKASKLYSREEFSLSEDQ